MSEPNRDGVNEGEKLVNEEVLEVPSAMLKSKTGFSIDIGKP